MVIFFLVNKTFKWICYVFQINKKRNYIDDSYDDDNMNRKIVCFIFIFPFCAATSVHDITASAFGSIVNGKLAAFGDFNADKHTDIFTLSNDGKKIGF